MRLSILIPVYNEADTIAAVLRRVVEAGLPAEVERELVVINDGSTDRTDQELRGFRDEHPDMALVYRNEPVNRGKGWCLRRGIALATGDVLVIQDADLEYDPADYAAMLQPILNDWADVPVSYRPRTRAEGKKIRFKDGLRAVYCIVRYTWPWRRSVVTRQSSVVRGRWAEGRER
jgi:glycosyltransferase involved in cell wall biosynthesis